MNNVVLMGRLTRNPEVRYSQGQKPMAVARYTLAVDRRFSKEGDAKADFIPCVAFGKNGEFAEKYLKKGTKIVIRGKIQTGSYTNREGKKVFTMEVVVEEQSFAESAGRASTYTDDRDNGNGYASNQSRQAYPSQTSSAQRYQNTPVDNNDFIDVPDGFESELPFM